MIKSHITKNKYHLIDMEIGDSKDFPIKIWDKIRLAAYFTGKKYGRKYITRKQKVNKNKYVVTVFRTQ